ncbi:FmdB family zinc ribbon protein [Chloroflexota bacterium]
MPIYDYQCIGCCHRFELRQGFDAEPVEVCPRCQGKAPRKFHSPTVIYKGSGFYTTDYARKNISVPGESVNGASPDDSPVPSEKHKEAKSSEV